LIAVQFQNAFSDNALKWLVSFLVLGSALTKQERDLWFVLVVPLLFAAPFLLFSIPEATLQISTASEAWPGHQGVRTAGDGTGDVGFGWPSSGHGGSRPIPRLHARSDLRSYKIRLLPELLPEWKLSWGNGIIELTTLLSAIFAALAGGFLATHFHGRQVWSGVVSCRSRSWVVGQPEDYPGPGRRSDAQIRLECSARIFR